MLNIVRISWSEGKQRVSLMRASTVCRGKFDDDRMFFASLAGDCFEYSLLRVSGYKMFDVLEFEFAVLVGKASNMGVP